MGRRAPVRPPLSLPQGHRRHPDDYGAGVAIRLIGVQTSVLDAGDFL
jgi:hypothetical protein